MKSEHRHQLESNDLADWIVRAAEQVRSRWLYLVVGLVVLVAAYAGVQYFSGASARKLRDAWVDYFGANNPGQFEAVADRHTGLVVSYYARLRAADLRFDEAKRELLNDYSGASLKLDKVVQSYDRLADDGQAPAEVRRHAALGKALALETQGNLSTAKTAYEKVANNVEFAGTAEALHAQSRLQQIDEPLAKRFYDQLARHEPPARGVGGSGQPLPELPPLPPESLAPDKPAAAPAPPIMKDLERIIVPPPPAKAAEKAGKPAKADEAKPSKPADKAESPASSTDAKAAKPAKGGDTKPSKPADKAGSPASSTDAKAAKPAKAGEAKPSKPADKAGSPASSTDAKAAKPE